MSSVVRLPGRPKRGPTVVGEERIIAETVNLLRRGDRFTTQKELAEKLGITPALLNYYFAKDFMFFSEAIISVIDVYASRFCGAVKDLRAGNKEGLDHALSIVLEMYIEERHLIDWYILAIGNFAHTCPISEMKKSLAFALSYDDEKDQTSAVPQILTDMIWGACSSISDKSHTALFINLAQRLIPSTACLVALASRVAGNTIDVLPCSSRTTQLHSSPYSEAGRSFSASQSTVRRASCTAASLVSRSTRSRRACRLCRRSSAP